MSEALQEMTKDEKLVERICETLMKKHVEQVAKDEELVERICRVFSSKQELPTFADGKIPLKVAAKVLGKSPIWIQTGMILGWLPIGIAIKDGKPVTSLDDITSDGRIDYTIYPKAFWELTGYVWKGEREEMEVRKCE